MSTNRTDWYIINSGYIAAPPTTSTIDTTVDFRGTLSVGIPLRYQIASVYYYGIITTISAVKITISGAPMGAALEGLWFSDGSNVIVKDYHLKELYNAAGGNQMLETFLKWVTGDMWLDREARLVRISHCHQSDDTAGVGFNPIVNFKRDTLSVGTSNGNTGLAVGATPAVTHTVVDINTTNYAVAFGSRIEVTVTVIALDNGDANGLSVWGTFVLI